MLGALLNCVNVAGGRRSKPTLSTLARSKHLVGKRTTNEKLVVFTSDTDNYSRSNSRNNSLNHSILTASKLRVKPDSFPSEYNETEGGESFATEEGGEEEVQRSKSGIVDEDVDEPIYVKIEENEEAEERDEELPCADDWDFSENNFQGPSFADNFSPSSGNAASEMTDSMHFYGGRLSTSAQIERKRRANHSGITGSQNTKWATKNRGNNRQTNSQPPVLHKTSQVG